MEKNESREGARAAVSRHQPQKPLSITVIGLYMLFGACVMPVNVFAHAPAFLIGLDLEAAKAVTFFIALGTVDAVIGIALLRLARWSRIVAIYFFLFRSLNTAITFLVPGSRARFEEGLLLTQRAMGLGSARPESPIWFGPAFELSVMTLVLWFLFTRKQAFVSAEERAAL